MGPTPALANKSMRHEVHIENRPNYDFKQAAKIIWISWAILPCPSPDTSILQNRTPFPSNPKLFLICQTNTYYRPLSQLDIHSQSSRQLALSPLTSFYSPPNNSLPKRCSISCLSRPSVYWATTAQLFQSLPRLRSIKVPPSIAIPSNSGVEESLAFKIPLWWIHREIAKSFWIYLSSLEIVKWSRCWVWVGNGMSGYTGYCCEEGDKWELHHACSLRILRCEMRLALRDSTLRELARLCSLGWRCRIGSRLWILRGYS